MVEAAAAAAVATGEERILAGEIRLGGRVCVWKVYIAEIDEFNG